MLAAAAVGYLCKHHATLSAAEGGCQAEIGVASSMAAALMATAYDAPSLVVENAAESALEHHLGMTCDPVAGYVQVPCIERCAFGAVKAWTAYAIASNEIASRHRVNFDATVAALAETAKDMNSKYKETSEAGLAALRHALLIEGAPHPQPEDRSRSHFDLTRHGRTSWPGECRHPGTSTHSEMMGTMHVSIRRAFITASVALAWTSLTFFTTSASAQSPQTTTTVQTTSAAAPQPNTERYRDGIIIWETAEDAKVPFLLKFNINTQLRYLNTQRSDETFTDHLGVTRDVNNRNDITVNRAMFILGGYIFDQRARYSFTVWTSAGAASIVIASNIGWQFNKAPHDHGWLHWRSRQSIAGQHVPVFYVNRPDHG